MLQCLYYFLCRLGLLSFANKSQDTNHHHHQSLPQHILRPKDIFALLIAAIGHDAAHPGVNNAFLASTGSARALCYTYSWVVLTIPFFKQQINSASPLALLYSDRSVLESLHSMTLFQIIQKHGLDQIGGGPSSSDYLGMSSSLQDTWIELTDYCVFRISKDCRHQHLGNRYGSAWWLCWKDLCSSSTDIPRQFPITWRCLMPKRATHSLQCFDQVCWH